MITSRLKRYVKTDVVICMGSVSSSVSPSLAAKIWQEQALPG